MQSVHNAKLQKLLLNADSCCEKIANDVTLRERAANKFNQEITAISSSITTLKSDMNAVIDQMKTEDTQVRQECKRIHQTALHTARKNLAQSPSLAGKSDKTAKQTKELLQALQEL